MQNHAKLQTVIDMLTGSLSSRCNLGLGRPSEETPLLLEETPSYSRPRKYREQPSVPFTLVAPDVLGQYLQTSAPPCHLSVQACMHAFVLLSNTSSGEICAKCVLEAMHTPLPLLIEEVCMRRCAQQYTGGV